MYATFDHYESSMKISAILILPREPVFLCCLLAVTLKTNMAAFRWHVCLFQRLHKDSDIFLFWLGLHLDTFPF